MQISAQELFLSIVCFSVFLSRVNLGCEKKFFLVDSLYFVCPQQKQISARKVFFVDNLYSVYCKQGQILAEKIFLSMVCIGALSARTISTKKKVFFM